MLRLRLHSYWGLHGGTGTLGSPALYNFGHIAFGSLLIGSRFGNCYKCDLTSL